MGLSASAPWRNYYGNMPVSLDYPHLTMYQLLQQTARQYPTNNAYIFMGKTTTYSAFMQKICFLLGMLATQVCLVCENSPSCILTIGTLLSIHVMTQ